MKAGETVYVSNPLGLGTEVKKATLIEHYLNHDGKGKTSKVWVVQYRYKGGIYHNISYESNMSQDSSLYEKDIRRKEIEEKISLLQKEYDEL